MKSMEKYVLVEFPEDAGFFEEKNIGYPCYNSKDNGARYVSEEDYIKHFGRKPADNSFYLPLLWPDSQEYLEMADSKGALCEIITADEKSLNDFGASAIWVPLCLTKKYRLNIEI